MSENQAEKESFMTRVTEELEQWIGPISMKISSQRHLMALRDAFPVLIPLTFVGGIAILLAEPPVPESITEPSNFFYAFLLAWKSWAAVHSNALYVPFMVTIGMTSVWVVMSVAYRLARSYNLDGLNNMISATAIFFIISDAFDAEAWSCNPDRFGASYMFGAILVAIGVVEINRFFLEKDIKIKMPETVPANITAPFEVMIPFIVNIFVFVGINTLLHVVTAGGILDLVFRIFQPLMRISNSLPAILVIIFLMEFFWFFGIHGDSMCEVVTTPILTMHMAENMTAHAAGEAVPNILSGCVMQIYGMWCCFIAFIIIMLFFCKSEQLKGVGKVAVAPAIFNINEPTIFGVPYVLNIELFIPKVICCILNFTTYYICASLNLVGRPFVEIPWTTPAVIQIGLATLDIRNMLLYFVLLAVDVVICYPFMKAYDDELCKKESGEAIAA